MIHFWVVSWPVWRFWNTIKTTQDWWIPSPKSWLQRVLSDSQWFFELRLQSLAICDFKVAAIRVTKHKKFNQVNVLNYLEAINSAERKMHSLTHVPFRSGCSLCQQAKGQQHYEKLLFEKHLSIIQLDHSFYTNQQSQNKTDSYLCGDHRCSDCMSTGSQINYHSHGSSYKWNV